MKYLSQERRKVMTTKSTTGLTWKSVAVILTAFSNPARCQSDPTRSPTNGSANPTADSRPLTIVDGCPTVLSPLQNAASGAFFKKELASVKRHLCLKDDNLFYPGIGEDDCGTLQGNWTDLMTCDRVPDCDYSNSGEPCGVTLDEAINRFPRNCKVTGAMVRKLEGTEDNWELYCVWDDVGSEPIPISAPTAPPPTVAPVVSPQEEENDSSSEPLCITSTLILTTLLVVTCNILS